MPNKDTVEQVVEGGNYLRVGWLKRKPRKKKGGLVDKGRNLPNKLRPNPVIRNWRETGS